MQAFPHQYVATAEVEGDGDVTVAAVGLPALASASPREFDGPGGRWSPETLVTAAVADCFLLTFRGVARASKFDWVAIRCAVEGTLDRVDRVVRFTRFRLRVTLVVPPEADSPAGVDREGRAVRLVHKAHAGCLVANSLKADTELAVEVVRASALDPPAATGRASDTSVPGNDPTDGR